MVLTSDGRYTDPLAIPANEAHIVGNLRTLSEFSVPEINQRLRSYLKFIFVREPFERLVSAYRNKFTRHYNTAFHKRYGTKIIRRHRLNPEPEALQRGHNVSFHEFVQYLVDPRTQREEPLNEHWERVHSLCHPCLIHYDVVGKYETLEQDAQAVLKLAGVEGALKFPTSGKSTRTDGDMSARFFKQISPLYQKKLFNMYRMDFLLFNYSTPEYLRTQWEGQRHRLHGPWGHFALCDPSQNCHYYPSNPLPPKIPPHLWRMWFDSLVLVNDRNVFTRKENKKTNSHNLCWNQPTKL